MQPMARAPQVARSASAGTWAPGSPFLWLLSFGETKESDCAAGRTSRPLVPAGNTTVDRGEEVGASPPHPDLLSLASPRESKQREGDPGAPVPALRSGQPAVLAPWAALRNSHRSLRSLSSDKRNESDIEAQGALAQPMALRSSAGAQGKLPFGPSLRSAWGSGHCFARPWRAVLKCVIACAAGDGG